MLCSVSSVSLLRRGTMYVVNFQFSLWTFGNTFFSTLGKHIVFSFTTLVSQSHTWRLNLNYLFYNIPNFSLHITSLYNVTYLQRQYCVRPFYFVRCETVSYVEENIAKWHTRITCYLYRTRGNNFYAICMIMYFEIITFSTLCFWINNQFNCTCIPDVLQYY